MPYITIGQQKLFYTRQGQSAANRPNLVLIHGAAGSHLDWPAQLRKVEGAVVYALDLPGHGRSEKPGRTTITDYAEVVAAFIADRQLGNVILIGHSMGGAIAQMLGLRPAAGLIGLVLIGTAARLRVTPAILDHVLDNFAAVADLVMSYEWAAGVPAEMVQISKRLWLQNDPVIVHGDYLACHTFDITGQLAAINLPTLVISGTADRLTPLKHGQFLADHLANATLLSVAGSGHMIPLEHPETVAGAVRQFIDELPAANTER